jgi:hypothetical protein
MTLAVLGVGFGRTGTLSLKLALETLGIAPCYHMVEVTRNPAHARVWTDAPRGDLAAVRALLADYAAAVDWPVTAFWRDMLRVFPRVRVVLTVRDSAEWYASFRETIVESSEGLSPPHDSHLRALYELTRDLILNGVFAGRAHDETYARAVYEAHNRDVAAAVPPERLLVFEAAAGWEPLCAFLGVPVPREPFPHVNARSSFVREVLGGAARGRRVTRSPR